MPTQVEKQTDTGGEVFLSGAEVRAWMQLSHEQLDRLVANGVLRAIPSRYGFKPIFKATEVASLAKTRSKETRN
jgi:hypothetical protein